MRNVLTRFIQLNRVELLVLATALVMALLSGLIYLNFGQASVLNEAAVSPEKETKETTSPIFAQEGRDLRGVDDESGSGPEPAQDSSAAAVEALRPGDSGRQPSPASMPAPASAPAAQPGSSGGGQASPPPPVAAESEAGKIHVTLAIDSGLRQLELPVSVGENSTVFELLQQASSRYGFSFGYSNDSSYGAFVEELDGVRNDPGTGNFWLYYVNGGYAALGASSQTLSEGDVILWRYENTR